MVRHQRGVRGFLSVYAVGLVLNQVLNVSHGDAGWITWTATLLVLITVVAFAAVLLPHLQQQVNRWDSAHENDGG